MVLFDEEHQHEGTGDISTFQKGTCHALLVNNASCLMFHLSSSLATMQWRIQGVVRFQLESPLNTCMHSIQLMSGQVGGTFLVTVQGRGFKGC